MHLRVCLCYKITPHPFSASSFRLMSYLLFVWSIKTSILNIQHSLARGNSKRWWHGETKCVTQRRMDGCIRKRQQGQIRNEKRILPDSNFIPVFLQIEKHNMKARVTSTVINGKCFNQKKKTVLLHIYCVLFTWFCSSLRFLEFIWEEYSYQSWKLFKYVDYWIAERNS